MTELLSSKYMLRYSLIYFLTKQYQNHWIVCVYYCYLSLEIAAFRQEDLVKISLFLACNQTMGKYVLLRYDCLAIGYITYWFLVMFTCSENCLPLIYTLILSLFFIHFLFPLSFFFLLFIFISFTRARVLKLYNV